MFEEQVITFQSGDKIFLFTDGLDFVFDEDKIVQRYMGKVGVAPFKNYIEEFLNGTIVEVVALKDDSTMVVLEIK